VQPSGEQDHLSFLRALFQDAIQATYAQTTLLPVLPKEAPLGRTLVLGAGKAAAAMAATVAHTLEGPLQGLVVVPDHHECAIPSTDIAIITAAHPIPDARSVDAARRMMALAHALKPQDRLIFLASGGGSSTLCLPIAGITLAQKQATIECLLLAGAPIAQINCVRKHMSAIKGGRLAAISGTADLHTFMISDVPGDDPAMIASGPTLADYTTLGEACAILEQYPVAQRAELLSHLNTPAMETPKPGAVPGSHTIIACADDALAAAETLARKKGWRVKNLGSLVEGEAREVGAMHASIALSLKKNGEKWLLLSGGETTVKVRREGGAGGPNLEYLAGLALALKGAKGIYALACDTDGIDGRGTHAGGVVTPDTLWRVEQANLDVDTALQTHNTHPLFKALDDLVITGPTRTNVNDFRAIAIVP
jgi:glycerate 2-kinase